MKKKIIHLILISCVFIPAMIYFYYIFEKYNGGVIDNPVIIACFSLYISEIIKVFTNRIDIQPKHNIYTKLALILLPSIAVILFIANYNIYSLTSIYIIAMFAILIIDTILSILFKEKTKIQKFLSNSLTVFYIFLITPVLISIIYINILNPLPYSEAVKIIENKYANTYYELGHKKAELGNYSEPLGYYSFAVTGEVVDIPLVEK